MKICEYKHDEIVHESRHCPLCEAINKIEVLEDEIKNLNENNE